MYRVVKYRELPPGWPVTDEPKRETSCIAAPALMGIERFMTDRDRIHPQVALLLPMLALGGLLLSVLLPELSQAQVITSITADGTLGTIVPEGCSVCDITGGTRPGNGPNLFHSFASFSVAVGDIANFNNETMTPTTNILARITGGTRSDIAGTIQTSGFGNANLFLMNPASWLFSDSASVNVGGIASFSTANFVRMFDETNSGKFYTDPAKDSLADSVLAVSPLVDFGFLEPAAIGFSGDTAPVLATGSTAAIHVAGLNVENGKSLFLMGRDGIVDGNAVEGVEITGTLSNRGGRIVIGSVDSAGQADLVKSASGTTFEDLNLGDFLKQGQVTLASTSKVDTRGTSALPDGGGVVIRAGRFVATGASIETGPSSGSITFDPFTFSLVVIPSPGQGGPVRIETTGTASFTDSTISSASILLASGSGSVTITTTGSETILLGNSTIDTRATAGGNGGQVLLRASTLDMQGGTINSGTSAGFGVAAGNSAEIVFAVGTLKLSGGATVTALTNGTEKAGAITVRGLKEGQPADEVIITGDPSLVVGTTLSSNTNGVGGGGDIVVNTGSLTITGKAAIESTTGGSGPAGSLTITASDSIRIDNQFSDISGGNILARSLGSGPGGDVTLTGNKVIFENGARVTVEAAGTGNAGRITVNAGTLTMSDGAQVNSASSAGATGDAGSVTIQGLASPADRVTITNSSLLTSSAGDGGGGSLEVSAMELILEGSTVSASVTNIPSGADPGSGLGNITLTSPSLRMIGGGITAEAAGSRNAGSIALNVGTLDAQGGAQISSSSLGNAGGSAGSVTIQGLASPADRVTITNSSLLTSSAGDGGGGSLEVSAMELILEGSTVSASVTNIPSGADPGSGLGNITLTAPRLLMNGGRVEAQTRGTRNGGAITFNVGTFETLGGAEVTSSSTGDATGNAGDVTVQGLGGVGSKADIVLLTGGSKITTEATQASGGDVIVNALSMVRLEDSIFSTSVFGPEGTVGGNITIDPEFVILQNSSIIARAFQGRGGNINITAEVFLADATSVVDASSRFGLSGAVTIESPLSNLSGALAPLPESPLQVGALLRTRCAARMQEGQASSFVQRGRDRLPPEPGGFVSSRLLYASPRVLPEKVGSIPKAPLAAKHSGLNEAHGAARWMMQDGKIPVYEVRGCS